MTHRLVFSSAYRRAPGLTIYAKTPKVQRPWPRRERYWASILVPRCRSHRCTSRPLDDLRNRFADSTFPCSLTHPSRSPWLFENLLVLQTPHGKREMARKLIEHTKRADISFGIQYINSHPLTLNSMIWVILRHIVYFEPSTWSEQSFFNTSGGIGSAQRLSLWLLHSKHSRASTPASKNGQNLSNYQI